MDLNWILSGFYLDLVGSCFGFKMDLHLRSWILKSCFLGIFVVCAYYSKNTGKTEWRRAMVLQRVSVTEINIYFIDHGVYSTVHYWMLRRLYRVNSIVFLPFYLEMLFSERLSCYFTSEIDFVLWKCPIFIGSFENLSKQLGKK